MDKRVKKAVGEFVNGVKKFDVDEIILYGSAARGDYVHGKSDVDILIVSKRPKDIYEKMLDVQTDVGLKYSAAFSVVMKTDKEFQDELKGGYPFIKNVLEEGEVLYGRKYT